MLPQIAAPTLRITDRKVLLRHLAKLADVNPTTRADAALKASELLQRKGVPWDRLHSARTRRRRCTRRVASAGDPIAGPPRPDSRRAALRPKGRPLGNHPAPIASPGCRRSRNAWAPDGAQGQRRGLRRPSQG